MADAAKQHHSQRADLAVRGRLNLELLDGLALRVGPLARIVINGHLQVGVQECCSMDKATSGMHMTSSKLDAQQSKYAGTSALALAERMVPSSVGDSARFCNHQFTLSIALVHDCLPLGLPSPFPSSCIVFPYLHPRVRVRAFRTSLRRPVCCSSHSSCCRSRPARPGWRLQEQTRAGSPRSV